MSERLTASLEDGTLEKLRELAGGERKVGAYLSDVVRFLAAYEELVSTEKFQDLCILPRIDSDKLPDIALQEITDTFNETLEEWRKESEAREKAMRDAYAQLMLRLVQLEKRLPTQQEDSSQNDA